MYKLLIVDDEKEIRSGLAEWPWETLSIEMTGSCSHGLEALQFVARQPVDIVLTDIRMPFMDGLELMAAMRREYPFTKIMILSGYSDFDYAKQAIRSGASDYLLKPVNDMELQASFARLTAALDEEKQDEYRTSVLERKEKLLAKKLREEFLGRLLSAPFPQEDLEQESSEGEVLLEGVEYTVAVIRLDRLMLGAAPVADRERRLIGFSLDNLLSDLWDALGNRYHWIDRSTLRVSLLAAASNTREDFVRVVRQLEKFVGLFKSTLSIGIGPVVQTPAEICRSAEAAAACLSSSCEESAVVVYEADLHAHALPVTGAAKGEPAAPDSGHKPAQADREREHALLVEAKKYIQAHYQNSITLKEVAANVYLSPGHLSALFKESGDTFLKYLTSIRMHQAMELLTDPRMKIYEVVEQVGYSDPAYFTEVFKKFTGQTPNEYRGNHH